MDEPTERSLVVLDADDDEAWDDDENLAAIPLDEESELGWYRCKVADKFFKVGAVVYAYERSHVEDGYASNEVHIRRGGKSWRYGEDEFEVHFEFDPQGQLRRQQEIAELFQALENMNRESQRMTASLRAGEAQTFVGEDSTALVPGGGNAVAAKRVVAQVRNAAGKMKLRMEATQRELEGMLSEQTSALRTQMRAMEEMVQKASKAIWVINLYLGVGEQVEQIRDGEPADKFEPIAIRQRRLYMDEECAITESGGIDFERIGEFDRWLLEDPAHLNQVLPERKGIVALRPRHKEKDRGDLDPWTKAEMAMEDRRTYFLMRNGEQLYRFWTSYEAGERLMPRVDEFLAYFRDSSGNPIKPGSEKWMKAQKEAAEEQLHYRQFFLLLQGLFDRTTIFAPLPGPVSLGNPSTWETIFTIVRDDEKTLSEGRERFSVWLKRVNAKLDVGMRVVGAWRAYEAGLSSKYETRLSPRNAERPHQDEIYRIERRQGSGGFAFLYKRHDTNWNSWADGNDEFQKRASCTVYTTDKFLLNLDSPDVRIDDLRYYLTSRLDRAEYAYMFPVLKVAIAALEAEAAEEAPFRHLLIGQMAQSVRVIATDFPEAEAAVDELIRWYKTANRWHRALLADDAKAIRLIVAEYKRRQALASAGESAVERDAILLDTAIKKHPDTLLFAQKPDGDYVLLVPENAESVFVWEQRIARRWFKWGEILHWRMVGPRWQSWRVIYTGSRWTNWNKNASWAEHLTDPERVELAKAGWEHALRRLAAKPDATDTPLLLAATAMPIQLWYRAEGVKQPASLLESPKEPKIQSLRLWWKRDAHRKAQLLPRSNWDSHNAHDYLDKSWTFFAGQQHDEMNVTGWPWQRKDGSPDKQVLWLEEANLEIARQDKKLYAEYLEPPTAFQKRVSFLESTINKAWRAAQEQAAFAKYLDDFGDLELWPAAKEKLVIPQGSPYEDGRLHKLITALLLAGVDPKGMTLAEAHERLQVVLAEAKPGDPLTLTLTPTSDEKWHAGRIGHWKERDTTPPADMVHLVIGGHGTGTTARE